VTPIAIEHLAASRTETGVVIDWRLSSQALHTLRDIAVERADSPDGPYIDRTPVPLRPERDMTFVDDALAFDRSRWYRLRLTSTSGESSIFGPMEATAEAGTPIVRLDTPVQRGSEGVAIRYFIAAPGAQYSIAIYTATGRLLRVLDRGFGHGQHVVSWDGTSDAGTASARGTYFVRLTSDRGSDAKKVLLLHR
jgi:hypothetical protein